MIGSKETSSTLGIPVLKEREIVCHSQVLGPLNYREEVDILVFTPPVLDPMNVRIAGNPTRLFHVHKTPGRKTDIHAVSGSCINGPGGDLMLVAPLQHNFRCSGGDPDLKGTIAVKARELVGPELVLRSDFKDQFF